MCQTRASVSDIHIAVVQLQQLAAYVERSTDQWRQHAEHRGMNEWGTAFAITLQKAEELRQSLEALQHQMQNERKTEPGFTINVFK